MLVLALALAGASARAETFLIQSGQDSSPYAFTPGLVRGAHSTAYVFTAFDPETGRDHSFEYYIRFNLPPELLVPGIEIEYAYAWVYHGYSYTLFGDFSDAIGELSCHEVLEPWVETGIASGLRWSNRPDIGPEFDRREEILNEGLYWCDVTELVEGWLADPSSNYGIALTSTLNRVMGFYTFQSSGVSPNFMPSLVVETVPEPAAATALLAGSLLLATLDRRRARRRRSQLHNPHPSERSIS
jgi:hypothetical protein